MTAIPLDQQVRRCRQPLCLSIWLPLIRTSWRLQDNSLKGRRKGGRCNEFWGNPVNGAKKREINDTKKTSLTPSSAAASSHFDNTSWSMWVGHHAAKLSGFLRFHSPSNARWPQSATAMHVHARQYTRCGCGDALPCVASPACVRQQGGRVQMTGVGPWFAR